MNEVYGTNYNKESLRSAFRRRHRTIELKKEPRTNAPQPMPKAFAPVIQVPLVPTLLIGDLHCPYHDAELLEKAVNLGISVGMEQIVILGDLFDFDGISRHPTTGNVVSLEQEMESAGKVLRYLANICRVYVVNGNHDERVAKKLDANFTMARLIGAALGQDIPNYTVHPTDYDYVYIGDDYIVGHLDRYSKLAGKVALEVAQAKKRHCIVGHDHLSGIQTDNQWLGVSLGSMLSKDKFWYKERRLTASPEFQNGFGILDDDGSFYHFDETGNTPLHGKKRDFAYWEAWFAR